MKESGRALVAGVRGDRTGCVWEYHPTIDRLECSGERYRARATDNASLACVHRITKDFWLDEIERTKHAIEVATRPEVAGAPTIRRFLDCHDEAPGPWGWAGSLTAIWEWADVTLHEFLDEPDSDPDAVADEVEANVRAALDVLHGIGVVHCDVAPNNIFRVDGVWKLGDMDSVTDTGQPVFRHPINRRWVHPERDVLGESPARDEFDDYGLAEILLALRAPSRP